MIKDMNLTITRHILLNIVLYLVCIVSAKIRGNILINTLCKGIRLQFILKNMKVVIAIDGSKFSKEALQCEYNWNSVIYLPN